MSPAPRGDYAMITTPPGCPLGAPDSGQGTMAGGTRAGLGTGWKGVSSIRWLHTGTCDPSQTQNQGKVAHWGGNIPRDLRQGYGKDGTGTLQRLRAGPEPQPAEAPPAPSPACIFSWGPSSQS